MSEQDVRRVEVLTEVLSGRRTVASAAIVLAVGVRQIHRLLIRFREDGGGAPPGAPENPCFDHTACFKQAIRSSSNSRRLIAAVSTSELLVPYPSEHPQLY